jgi:hypothetical protein
MVYEAPEVVEIGKAEDVVRGMEFVAPNPDCDILYYE